MQSRIKTVHDRPKMITQLLSLLLLFTVLDLPMISYCLGLHITWYAIKQGNQQTKNYF